VKAAGAEHGNADQAIPGTTALVKPHPRGRRDPAPRTRRASGQLMARRTWAASWSSTAVA
jgi:hypothetical protein